MLRFLLHFVVVAICVGLTATTLSSSDKKGNKKSKETATEAPNESTVLEESLEELGLMDVKPRRGQLVKYFGMQNGFASSDIKKNFPKPTLGFITPWNNYGYDFAKEFAIKFDMISPVWLQIRSASGGDGCFLTGTHDVDMGWMAELRKRNRNIKIVPRFMFDGWQPQQFEELFSSEDSMQICIRAIKSSCEQYGFDGAVIEIWLQAGSQFKSDIIHFMGDLKVAMNDEDRLAILVLPPAIRDLSSQNPQITRDDFAEIAPVVDYITLMTYDYFSQGKPGPSSPLPWVRGNVEVLAADGDPNREKILTGLNFYGYDFTSGQYPQPKLARDFVEVLKKHKSKAQIKWDTFGHENYIEYEEDGKRHWMFYPTLRSLKDKLDIAQQMNTGAMIWEIGQGARIFNEIF